MSNQDKNFALAGTTRDEFVSLWRSARRGDATSKIRLYDLLKKFPTLTNFSRQLGRSADKYAAEKAAERASGKKHVNHSQWTRNQDRLLKSPAKVFSGGLPSLGKK